MTKIMRSLLFCFAGALILFFAVQIVDLFRYKNSQNETALSTASETTQALKSQITTLLEKVESEGQALGARFGGQEFTIDEIKDIIRQTSLDFPEIRGVTACYEPDAFSPDRRLFCPYYNKGTGEYLFVEDNYDYTVRGPGTAWYTNIIDNGASWINPYYGAGAQEWFIDYGVPFYYETGPKKGQIRGIIDFSLEVGDFKNLIHSITVGKAGYSFLASGNNTLIAHPIADNVGTKTLDDLAQSEANESLLKAYEGMKAAGAGQIEFYDEDSHQAAVLFYDHIPISDFKMGLVFFKRDLIDTQAQMNRRLIKLALTFSLLMLMLLGIYFGRDYLDPQEIEVLSVLASLLLFGNVLFIGYLQHSLTVPKEAHKSAPIVDNSSLGSFVDGLHARADTLKIDKGTPVPTGIFIERLSFEDSYDVNIGGLVWQKYPMDIVDDIETGIRFPQMSPFAEAAYIEETSRAEVNPKEGVPGYMLIKYEFRVTLRLNLKYKNFPFDKRHLDLKIAPMKTVDNLILIPDLDSYASTNPMSKSGLSEDIYLSGNMITESYFNFSRDDFGASFGGVEPAIYQNVPMLHYNIHVKRRLLNAFVTYLIPIGVALALIYILILACHKTEARQGIIESMAAFFFVLIFSHIDLRKDIVTADLIFIEYFYFITYLMIILTTLNLMIYTKDRSAIFDYNENQLYRVSYFPIFFGLLLVVMLTKFY